MAGAGDSALDELIAKIKDEPDATARRRLLAGELDCRTPEAVQRLYDEVVRLARIDLRQADRIARAASRISRATADPSSIALGVRALGHVAYLRGRHAAAQERYREALAIYEKLGMEVEIGRTLSGGSLQSLIYLGAYDEAFRSAERAREIFTRHGDRLRLARLDVNVANVLYRQDRFEEALATYRRAADALRESGEPQDVAIAFRNMAVCQISLNDFAGALETYRAAKSWCARCAMPLLSAEADYNIAYLHYLRGEYTKAIELYGSAREHCEAVGDSYHQGLCDLDQSEMYLELSLVEEAERLAGRALDAFRKLGMRYETAKATANLAIAAARHGSRREALQRFGQARTLFVQENNRAWIAIVDLYRAMVLAEDHNFGEARRLARDALAYFNDSPWAAKAAACELLLARVDSAAGKAGEAREFCLAALSRLGRAGSPALACEAWATLGEIEETRGEPEAAMEAYRKAHEGLESLRGGLRSDELKIAFQQNRQSVYEHLVRLCLEEAKAGDDRRLAEREAFGYIEQSKSRSLADLIAFRAQAIPAAVSGHRDLMARIGALRTELGAYNRALRSPETRSAPALARLRDSIAVCENRLVEALADLRVRDSEAASLQTGSAIELDTVAGSLPPGATLLQFFRVRDRIAVGLLSREDLRIRTLGAAPEVRRILQLLRFQLSKFRLGPEYVRTFQPQLVRAANGHLQELHSLLIAPIEELLDAPHLVIAPHGFLHYLPFHALLGESGWLGDRHTISYTPSASVFYLCRRRPPAAREGALILGAPDPAAPGIRDEVEAVAAALPGASVYVGAEATLERLRSDGASTRYIHLATHGWFRQDNPMFSSIALGDSQLSLFDLYQLSLPAEMVVLSGCGTGLNVVVGGDELLGLLRGVLYAGAHSVMATLWDVHDSSTTEFMSAFYRHLRAAPDKASALQLAAEQVRDKYPHPFYWAPFFIVGNYDIPQ